MAEPRLLRRHRASSPARSRGRRAPPPPPAPPSARRLALEAFLDFEKGGPLPEEPPAALTDSRDRAFYVQLLHGLVRHRRFLEREVFRLAQRPRDKVHPLLAAVAMLGLYQLRFLDAAPHAALYETVELTKQLQQGHAAGWMNGVLRTAQREGWRGTDSPAALGMAMQSSHPDWMLARWRTAYGAETADALCMANNAGGGLTLRPERRVTTREALRARLEEEGVPVQTHPLYAAALHTERAGAALRSAAFAEGTCTVQDAPSQLLMDWVGPLLTGRVLDACAAPGGKLTLLLGDPDAPPRVLVGMDALPGRLPRVRENLARLGLAAPLLAGDAALPPFAQGFDAPWQAILLDVPCSSTGTIAKNPDIKWRRREEDIFRHAASQAALLDGAARCLQRGGLLLYSTCSLEPEENQQQVAAFLDRQPSFARLPLHALSPPPGAPAVEASLTPEGDLLVLPGATHGGLYGALLRKMA